MRIYQSSGDFDTNVIRALEEIDPAYQELPGLIIVGSHAPSDIDEKLEALQDSRIKKIPTLGICFGMQLMVIEFARNVCGLKEANSVEIDPDVGDAVVVKMDEPRYGIKPDHEGQLQSHWHNYKINPDCYDTLRKGGLTIAENVDDNVAEMIRILRHPYYVGVQWHPEYQSSEKKPHPILKTFLGICKSAFIVE